MNHTLTNEKKTPTWDIPDDGMAHPWTYRGVTYAADHERGIWTVRDDNELEWVGVYDPETDTLRKTREPYFESDPFIKDLLSKEQQWRDTTEELARTQSQLERTQSRLVHVAFELILAQSEVARLSAEMEHRIRQEVELRIRQEMSQNVVDPLQPSNA